ncbi:Two-component response regulator [Methanosarcina horonobensis HB-1 = JCM 15518]|uniref:Two-component response regulator n=1 Tax=Methanosarcina horonobensis HB-1 = JCM 15518 TaxID=1434110 RepID=A0A0E3WVS4_9EURY|nr:response regulator [Methanosarcina horonobensis]AKB80565.1 Two-component response regulator [Methanosarcina horonobensis HB-1 = JCM 15518]
MPEILIVEDNLLNLVIEADLLKSCGYDPKKAKNGFEALEVLNKVKVDLVLMDMELPKMHGLELLQRIKCNPDTQNIKVVAVTGHCDPESKQKFLKAGCHAILSKPINFDSFGSQIKEFLKVPNSLH